MTSQTQQTTKDAGQSGQDAANQAANAEQGQQQIQPGSSQNIRGEKVTVTRIATSADMGYRDNKGDQFLVRFDDGHEEVVAASDLQSSGSGSSSSKKSGTQTK